MILIDPKVVEMKMFASLPHLMVPVVTEPKKAAGALKWAVREMETRYAKMAQANAREISRYNALQEDEGIEWRNRCARIAQYDGTNAGDKGTRACHIGKHSAVV